jgi:hypothetical protein
MEVSLYNYSPSRGTHHLNQCDAPFANNPTLASLVISQQQSELPNEVAHQVNMDICHAFLKRHLLKGK